jgi:hypothetical protein
MTDIPLPSPGSPRYRFPCFNGTMRMCDSRRPSHRASFPSLGDTRRRACRFAPNGPARSTVGLGFVIRSPLPEKKTPGDDPGLPSSWGTLMCLRPALRPRRDRRYRDKAKLRQVGTAPRTAYREGSPREVISGLDNMASALAVYASPRGSPQRTQDSLLAAGQALPDGIGYPQGSDERFPRCFLHRFPLSQASWRKR